MSKEFPLIKPEDFTTITTERLPHQEVEMAIMAIGKKGVSGGTDFKYKLLKAAGWKKMRLSTYAGDPDMAADAFNKIRVALAQTDDPDRLLELVSQ